MFSRLPAEVEGVRLTIVRRREEGIDFRSPREDRLRIVSGPGYELRSEFRDFVRVGDLGIDGTKSISVAEGHVCW